MRLILIFAGAVLAFAQGAGDRGFIDTKTYTPEQDREILKLYEGLRVADVSDGLDMAGLQDIGLINPEIRPLWRDTDDFTHIIRGIAVTVRYVPTNKRASKMPVAEFPKWEGSWYNQLSSEPFVPLLRQGSVVVIDANEDGDTGTIGSNNIMLWKSRGAVGVVTSGGARDTDEIITQKVPMYLRQVGRGIRPGRTELESVNRPVVVGGVLVKPGDVVIGDGEGVLVVPRAQALEVAAYAHKILEGDKNARRDLYKQLGLPEDPSVK